MYSQIITFFHRAGAPARVGAFCLLLAALIPCSAETYQISGTNILHDGTNWVGGGVDAFDQNGIQSKGTYPIKIVREVVQDLSECPIYSSDGVLSNALGYLHPLQDIVNYNRSNGAVTILCPFGWDAGTNRVLVGITPSSKYYYPQFKQRLAAMAQAFTNQPDVWIDVWNEPYAWDNTGFTESQWASDMNDLYNTIRQAGNTNIILIPGQANDSQETVLLDQSSFLNGKYNTLATIHCYNGWTLGSQAGDASRIQAIHAAGWALIFAEVGRDAWESDCTRVLDAAVENQITSLGWSWSASDGSSLVSGGVPTDWGNQFLPYLPVFLPNSGIPPIPTAAAGSPVNGQAAVTWLPSSGAVTYNIRRSSVAGTNYSLLATGLPTPAYNDTNIVWESTYHYVVSAVNSLGESGVSGDVAVTVPVTCIVDNADASGATVTGAWISSTYTAGYWGTNYLQDGDTGNIGGKSVRFTPNIPAAGTYNVYACWTTGTNRATNVPIDVVLPGSTNTFYVNQQLANGVWVLLGAFNFNVGTNGYVQVRNDGANGYVIADAVELVAASLAPLPPALGAIANQSILAGRTLLITNTVTDSNLPPLTLAFRLVTAPAGSVINPNSGLISWRPDIAQENTTNEFVVAASDTAGTGMGATQQFSTVVLAPRQPLLQSAGLANGAFHASVAGDSGPDYSVLVSSNLTTWTVLFATNSPALPLSITDPAATNSPHRFYRIQLGP